MIRLSTSKPLASGQKRLVFDHPHYEDEVIKVMRPELVAARFGPRGRWYKRLYRARQYVGFVRELKEYIAVTARHPERIAPIVRLRGVIETDLGLGIVTEKVRGHGNTLAPTLAEVYGTARGFTPAIVRGLHQLRDQLLTCEVIVTDLHPWNVVYGRDSRAGARFVLIDGFGEKNVIPRLSISRRINRWNTNRLFDRLLTRVPMLLDTEIATADVAAR